MRYLYNEAIDDILSLCPASDGSLYVGTVSGLLRLHNSGKDIKAEHIGKKSGLVNDMIHGILEDSDGIIWLGTDRGLVKYNPANSLAQTYLFSAGVELGGFSDDAYYKDSRTGMLFLGGNGGLIALEPHTPEMVQYFTNIQLRSLEVAHEAVRISDYTDKNGNLVFKGSNVSFAVTFAVPDYQAADFIVDSAFLEGYDKEWSPYTLGKQVSYTDVPAGTYTLRLRYKKDVYGNGPEEFRIKVRIHRSFFYSPFFLILVALAFLALLVYCLSCTRIIREAREKGTAAALSDEVLKMLADVITRKTGGKKDRIRMEELGSLADDISCNNEDDMAFVRKTIEVLSENITREDLGTALIADRMAMTPRSFYRRFRSISRITPGALIKIYRLEMASRLLLEGDKQILDVLAEVGISSRSYFYKEFTERFGMTPGAWKAAHGVCAEDECAK
jgi:AraC-like DNA-binding protein